MKSSLTIGLSLAGCGRELGYCLSIVVIFTIDYSRQKQGSINQPASCHAAKQAPPRSSQPGQKMRRNMALPQPKMKTANS